MRRIDLDSGSGMPLFGVGSTCNYSMDSMVAIRVTIEADKITRLLQAVCCYRSPEGGCCVERLSWQKSASQAEWPSWEPQDERVLCELGIK